MSVFVFVVVLRLHEAVAIWSLAESEGFEPSIQVYPVCFLSREVPSTTRPALRFTAYLVLYKGAILRETRIKINEKMQS